MIEDDHIVTYRSYYEIRGLPHGDAVHCPRTVVFKMGKEKPEDSAFVVDTHMSPTEARQVAAMLLRAANEAER